MGILSAQPTVVAVCLTAWVMVAVYCLRGWWRIHEARRAAMRRDSGFRMFLAWVGLAFIAIVTPSDCADGCIIREALKKIYEFTKNEGVK